MSQVQIDKSSMVELSELVATAVVNTLEQRGLLGKPSANPKVEKSAYQKTEQLLYNYMGFKRIVAERQQEIEDLRMYGVPGRSSGFDYKPHGNLPQGIVLDEERVEAAVHNVEHSVQGTVQAIALIDKCMAALSKDPYYKILEMRYFEGRTLEDIGVQLNCTQPNVSYHKNRLVRELSMRIFPDQAINEMMN